MSSYCAFFFWGGGHREHLNVYLGLNSVKKLKEQKNTQNQNAIAITYVCLLMVVIPSEQRWKRLTWNLSVLLSNYENNSNKKCIVITTRQYLEHNRRVFQYDVAFLPIEYELA